MELFAADGHDAGGCERVTGKSGMRPWRHRESVDIDIVLPDVENIASWMEGRKDDIGAQTGGTFEECRAEHITLAIRDGKLDIACYEPRPPGLEAAETVLGEKCHTMSNTQILRGKVERTRKQPTRRDAYDIGIAERKDPTALAEAVNAVPGRAIMICLQNIAVNKDRLNDDSIATLKGVPTEYEEVAADAARRMAAGLTGALYTGIEIEVEDGTTIVRRSTVRGELAERRFENKSGGHVLRMTALDSHLRYNTTWAKTAKETIDKLEAAQKNRQGIAIRVGGFVGSEGDDRESGTPGPAARRRDFGPEGPEQTGPAWKR